MKRFTLTLLLLPLLVSGRLAAEEWIGLDDRPALFVGADIAVEDTGDFNGGVNLGLALGDSAEVYAVYHSYELSDEDEEFRGLSLATALWFDLTALVDVEVSYFFEGDIDEIEKETLGLALGLNRGDWSFRVEFANGDLQLFTREVTGDVLNNLVPERIDSDLTGYGLVLGWQQQAWYWQLTHQRYDYEEDLSPLANSRFAQFIVKSSQLAQNSLLISKYTAFLFGYADFENDYALLLAQDQSAIDEVYTNSLTMSWQHWTSRHLGYLVAASFSESEDAGLTLGLRWVM